MPFHNRNIDFADALLAAKSLASDERALYSFGRDFDPILGLIGKEPT